MMSRNGIVLGIVILLFVVGGLVFVFHKEQETLPVKPAPDLEKPETETFTSPRIERIGESVEKRPIDVVSFGDGPTHLLFIGGIHGGYEWNSVLLAYQAIDYLTDHSEEIPSNLTVDIIPALNPDGLFAVTKKEGRFTHEDVQEGGPLGTGRVNAHGIDLNRNFGCKWKPTSMWRGKEMSAGSKPFSEPEAQTLKNFVEKTRPDAVVFWHSQANAVYASECENGILPRTRDIMNVYGDASGYAKVESFDAYPITGDAEGWLASINIPAITVELATHQTIEWEKNKAGMDALIELFSRASSTAQQN